MKYIQSSLALIADVANSKRHQRLDKIIIIFTHTIQEISTVVCKKAMSETCTFKTSLCCMKRTHYSKRMLRKQHCVKFLQAYCMTQVFFENNFADFSYVVQLLVAFPISNIPYIQHGHSVNRVYCFRFTLLWVTNCEPTITLLLFLDLWLSPCFFRIAMAQPLCYSIHPLWKIWE